jgi:hypothetical protein
VFLGDALYEIDVEGVKPPRMIMEKMGGLNGFEFGPDDRLYGPLWFKGVTLEYPMSATAKGDEVILSSWFTGTVQVIDRKTGATREMMHDFKAPHDAIRLADGSILVSELGSKSLIRAGGEHGKDRNVLIGGLEGPVGLVGGARVMSTSRRPLPASSPRLQAMARKPSSPRI